MCSDLSAIHGIRDAGELDSPVFFALAVRLPAYRGAVAARVAALRAETGGAGDLPLRPAAAAAKPSPEQDLRTRFMAAQNLPVATAADLAAISARASLPGQPAGRVVQIPSSSPQDAAGG